MTTGTGPGSSLCQGLLYSTEHDPVREQYRCLVLLHQCMLSGPPQSVCPAIFRILSTGIVSLVIQGSRNLLEADARDVGESTALVAFPSVLDNGAQLLAVLWSARDIKPRDVAKVGREKDLHRL
jgi:hypothetical protein